MGSRCEIFHVSLRDQHNFAHAQICVEQKTGPAMAGPAGVGATALTCQAINCQLLIAMSTIAT